MLKIPKSNNIQLIDYALGIYDSKIGLWIKAETLKMLMHFRDLEAESILRRLKNYFLTVNARNRRIQQIFKS